MRKEAPADGDRDDAKEAKRPRRDRQKKITEKRTVFVGNVPLTTSKKALIKLFKQFGEIESVRFRCAPIADPATKKKVAVITKEFHEKRNNISSFICFKEKESAKNALELNGHLIDGLHIRVDSAKPKRKHETERSIFVGNLSFSVEEEDIRNHFQDCGKIENVRVVRDRKTNLGKGFCYILFKSAASVALALKKNKSELKKRELRVQRCLENSKNELDTGKKKKKKVKTPSSDTPVAKPSAGVEGVDGDKKTRKKTSKMWRPTNASNIQFQQAQMLSLKKKWRQAKKKKKNAQESKKKDGELTKVLGPAPQAPAKSSTGKKDFRRDNKAKKVMKGPKGLENSAKSNIKKKLFRRERKDKTGWKGGNFKGNRKSSGNR